jgi:hypothetical protein
MSPSHLLAGNLLRTAALLGGLLLLLVLVEPRLVPSALRPQPMVEVAVEGRSFKLQQGRAEALAGLSAARFRAGAGAARERAEGVVGVELDRMFSELSSRLPAYADWYYSFRGEYARMSMFVLGGIGLTDGDLAARKAAELIFGDDAFGTRVDALVRHVDGELAAHAQSVGRDWLAEVLEVLSRDGREQAHPAQVPDVDLNGAFTDFVGHSGGAFVARVSASTAAGAGVVVGPLVARIVSRPAMRRAGSPVVARTAARVLTKSSTAGGGGLLGCAIGGAAALPCVLIVGGATWLATDWMLLHADEWLHRDALIADWQQRLDELRTELERSLLATYDAHIDVWYGEMNQRVMREFSPIDAFAGRVPAPD